MKSILLGLVLLAPCGAWAASPTVEITSFVSDGPSTQTHVAELCGRVAGTNGPVVVRVVSDDKSNKPGVYNVLVDKDGLFCTLLLTYTGTASASVWTDGKIQMAKATLTNKAER